MKVLNGGADGVVSGAYYHSHFAPDLLAGRLIVHFERAIRDYHRR